MLQLLDSYRLIIDATETLSNALPAPGRSPPAETMERMLQSATYGAQMLESATVLQPIPSETRPVANREPEESREVPNGSASSKRPVRLHSHDVGLTTKHFLFCRRPRSQFRRDRHAWDATPHPHLNGDEGLWVSPCFVFN